jgi:hypothetical protein
MLQRIELKNFMSHRHTLIEPAAGLTVLVGPNNCGKSALVAALQILCSNESSTYVMRHGERECSVEVETSDGHIVRWSRKTSPSYCINGQLYDRLRNAGLPEELHRVLRLPPVDAGEGSSFDIHFGCQKSPIFLLDQPPAAAAKFFASSSDAIRLVEIQRRHREKYQEKQKEKSRLEAESRQLNAELDALQPTAEIDHRLRATEELHQARVLLAESINQLETESSRIEGQTTVVAYHQAQSDALTDVAAPPALEPTAPLIALLDSLDKCRRDQKMAAARTAALRELGSPPALVDTDELARIAGKIAALDKSVHEAAARNKSFQVLQPPPAFLPTADLESTLGRLRDVAELLEAEQERWRVLEPLAMPLEAVPSESLEKLTTELRTTLGNTKELENCLGDIEREMNALTSELRELAADSTCPTCGAPLNPERLLALAASGGGHRHA